MIYELLVVKCRYYRYPAPKGRCHGNQFWLSMGYNFGYIIANDTLFDFWGVFGVKLSHEYIANVQVLTDIVMATIFGVSMYGAHIGATWRIRLNCPSAVAMWPTVKLL